MGDAGIDRFGALMENYRQANKEIWDLGINRRARKLGGNLGQGKGRERKGPTVGGSENNLGGGSAWERDFGPCQKDPKSGIPQCEGKTQLQARGPSLHSPFLCLGEGWEFQGQRE